MKRGLLPWLACPHCRGALKINREEPEDIVEGLLRCSQCQGIFPIAGSIPKIFSDAQDPKMLDTRLRFAWEWERYPGTLEEDRRVFLEETQIPAESWNHQRVLEVGCGMGRYSRVARELGAEVVAFDLSDALTRLTEQSRRDPKLHLVQGDILRPPFREGAFDIVFSQGVLHHTPDTARAFRQAAALVRQGGFLSIWVYGRPGGYQNFATNPLRPGRQWLKGFMSIVWGIVWIRLWMSDFLRAATTRLPSAILYALCYPLATLGSIPILKYLTFSVHPDFRVRLHENFDWLAPPYQHKHTKEEVRAWFESAGFSDLKILPHGMVPKVGIVGRKR